VNKLTIVLLYSYLPMLRLLASMAELMSLKMIKAWPLMRIFFLAMIFLHAHIHRLFIRTLRRCWKVCPSTHQ